MGTQQTRTVACSPGLRSEAMPLPSPFTRLSAFLHHLLLSPRRLICSLPSRHCHNVLVCPNALGRLFCHIMQEPLHSSEGTLCVCLCVPASPFFASLFPPLPPHFWCCNPAEPSNSRTQRPADVLIRSPCHSSHISLLAIALRSLTISRHHHIASASGDL